MEALAPNASLQTHCAAQAQAKGRWTMGARGVDLIVWGQVARLPEAERCANAGEGQVDCGGEGLEPLANILLGQARAMPGELRQMPGSGRRVPAE